MQILSWVELLGKSISASKHYSWFKLIWCTKPLNQLSLNDFHFCYFFLYIVNTQSFLTLTYLVLLYSLQILITVFLKFLFEVSLFWIHIVYWRQNVSILKLSWIEVYRSFIHASGHVFLFYNNNDYLSYTNNHSHRYLYNISRHFFHFVFSIDNNMNIGVS